jgi:hypothetical protein
MAFFRIVVWMLPQLTQMKIPSTVELLGIVGAEFVSSTYEASIEIMY